MRRVKVTSQNLRNDRGAVLRDDDVFLRRNDVMGDKIVENGLSAFVDTKLVCIDLDFGRGWGLIRIVNASEVLNLALTSLLIQALGVTLLGDLKRDIDMNLHERNASLLMDLAGYLAIGDIRGDEGGGGDDTNVSCKFGYLGDAANVLLAIVGTEAEVAVETEANVVTVETVDEVALLEHLLLEGDGDCGFAGA